MNGDGYYCPYCTADIENPAKKRIRVGHYFVCPYCGNALKRVRGGLLPAEGYFREVLFPYMVGVIIRRLVDRQPW